MTTSAKLFALDARSSSNRAASEVIRREVRTGLELCLARLWRYALVLSATSDAAEDLVQATCLRAIERADQFVPGTRLDRWLFAILRSIWLDEIRARRISEGGGFVDAEDALGTDGEQAVESNILAAEVFKAIGQLSEAQRETVLLVYGESYSYAETASTLGIPIGSVMSRLAAVRSALATPSSASPTTPRGRCSRPIAKIS
jgi:RNA polymerase sigma-70 factor, ECF subfamily